jgi:NADH:ubiquinone oxidoreductase subunit 6 (subunit J)
MIVTLLLVLFFLVVACAGVAGLVLLRSPSLKLLSVFATFGSVLVLLFGLGGARLLYGSLDRAADGVGGTGGLLFWVFAILTCGGAIAVVATQNIVRMAFWLVVSLGSVAALFFLLHADFLGSAQLLIYVGGTVVLLVFGVMLTASGHTIRVQTSPGESMLGAGVGLILLCVLVFAIGSVDWTDISSRIPDAGDSPVAADAKEDRLIEQPLRDLDQQLADLKRQSADLNEQLKNASSDDAKAEIRHSISAVGERLKAVEARRPEVLLTIEDQRRPVEARRQSGRTLRPLGLSFFGLRPDRNLNQPSNQTLAPGYLLPFEIISIHLLVVLIGAAYLARAKRRVTPGSGTET